ncbi:hypothetical protein T4C_13754 [Trichinella pseudospiralis]|uniref:Uncharacterized protein n=1 Tax=Trichinella pseudospiralis TaxID=6337 RepID=A0A0V1JTM2_TRIPS|nr:hypothetical protein T4C_13754 [Trichinella pseudospiralis]
MLKDTAFFPVPHVDTGDSLLEAGTTDNFVVLECHEINLINQTLENKSLQNEKINDSSIENGEEKKNTDDTVHKSIDGTKRIKRKQEACMTSCIVTMNKRKSENARTRVKEADRGRHEAELWNEDIRYMWFPKGPNLVSLG